jgi:cytochrome c-type biogenesis protein CcmH
MNEFLLAAAGMLAVALACVLPALLRRGPARAAAGADPNLAVLRHHLGELQSELRAGSIDAGQFQIARAELERRVLDEAQAPGAPSAGSRMVKTALAIGLGMPLFATLAYAALGNPAALSPEVASSRPVPEAQVTPAQIGEMVERLAQRLRNRPEDAEGWAMLARSYGALGRYEAASEAYARASALTPGDAQLLADRADALAMAQGRSAAGEPWRLIQEALRIDPDNVKALALAGSAALERKEYGAAAGYWEKARALVPPESGIARFLEAGLKDARALAQAGTPGAVSAVKPAATQGPAGSPAAMAAGQAMAQGRATLAGRVLLGPGLAARVAPDDTVFVYARAADGPPMPLAVARYRAGDLPLRFRLDDSMAMAPQMILSGHPRVIVGARISRSGNAVARPGDLQGQLAPGANDRDGLVLVIDQIVP